MHTFDESVDDFASEVFAFARRRVGADAAAGGLRLGRTLSRERLDADVGPTISEAGLGASEALRLFAEVLEPACLSVDFPRYFAFVPAGPTEVSVLADLVVSACSIYAGSWLEGSGAVWAENQALRWLADLAGLPAQSGGCFVAGGTMGNLSALVAAREAARMRRGDRPIERATVVAGASSHSSVLTATTVMDAELVVVPGVRLEGGALREVLRDLGDRTVAVVATAGSTNLGIVDDLSSVAPVCRDAGVWLHVDAAYGGAALAAPSVRHRFNGIELADSLIVDPHKWLFAPFDACALLYRDAAAGRAAHVQHASYLDVLSDDGEWNPSDYAVHLSRRARGLPLWFSLAAYGTRAYSDAVEACLATTRHARDLVEAAGHLDLVCEPELSIVAFTRKGWTIDRYRSWSEQLLHEGTAFVVPSSHEGAPILRLCIVNPRTTVDDVRVVVDSLE